MMGKMFSEKSRNCLSVHKNEMEKWFIFQAVLWNSLKLKFLKAMSLDLNMIRKRKEIVDQ